MTPGWLAFSIARTADAITAGDARPTGLVLLDGRGPSRSRAGDDRTGGKAESGADQNADRQGGALGTGHHACFLFIG